MKKVLDKEKKLWYNNKAALLKRKNSGHKERKSQETLKKVLDKIKTLWYNRNASIALQKVVEIKKQHLENWTMQEKYNDPWDSFERKNNSSKE